MLIGVFGWRWFEEIRQKHHGNAVLLAKAHPISIVRTNAVSSLYVRNPHDLTIVVDFRPVRGALLLASIQDSPMRVCGLNSSTFSNWRNRKSRRARPAMLTMANADAPGNPGLAPHPPTWDTPSYASIFREELAT
ncbi:hypothetical protein CWO89_44850 [Bradyrhizobium sp. Leo170]|nr:hypothetical protein CWO89_44850 [Bradyrhizobium sp. Leo170]